MLTQPRFSERGSSGAALKKLLDRKRNYETKLNLERYARPEYVEEPHPEEALMRFTVHQYLRLRGSTRTIHHQLASHQQAPSMYQQNQAPQLVVPHMHPTYCKYPKSQ